VAVKPAQTRVWDWAIRLFHWLIVIIIPLMWWTAEEGYMDWHRRLGMAMLGLVIFRLMWGLIGSWTARFRPMIKRLGSLGPYLRDLKNDGHNPSFGHSPLGILSVFAMIGTLVIQVSTGLFTVDVDGLESGPLAVLVSFEVGREFADIHELNFNILSTFISLHIVAILIYQFVLKDNLIGPMVTGVSSAVSAEASGKLAVRVQPVAFATGALIALGGIYAVLNLS